jgi:dipeptidyl aminopeptidase/acylaminoacyl peptidase
MTSSRRVHGCWLAVVLWVAIAVPLAAQDGDPPARMLLLGPLPPPPVTDVRGPLAPSVATVPELDPAVLDPWGGAAVLLDPGEPLRWREVSTLEGSVELAEAGVYWLATALTTDRWSELTVDLAGAATASLWIDGIERVSAAGDSRLEAAVQLARGHHLLVLRVVSESEKTLQLKAAAKPNADLKWSADPRHPPARHDEGRGIVAVDSLAVDPTGGLVARRLRYRDPTGDGRRSEVGILDASGRSVAPSIGDGSAQPLAFSPSGRGLLLTAPADEGSDLLLFDLDSRRLRMLLRDEPGLGAVKWSPDGRHLMMVSTRGASLDEPEADGPQRRRALREKVSDYRTEPHLHLVDIASGARRRLTAPGDWVLDDASFTPDGRQLVYARTLPQSEHPWFATELRLFDLGSGEDRLIATFTAGWESRPRRLAVSPDGGRLAFLGPPEEIGAGPSAHNQLQAAVHLLDLSTGEHRRISGDSSYAFTIGSGELLSWSADGSRLVVTAIDRTRGRISTLVDGGAAGWRVEPLPETGGESLSSAAVSSGGGHVACVVSSRDRLPRLTLADLGSGEVTVLEEPNAAVEQRWLLAEVHDASYTGPSGDPIDAWWYEPPVTVDEDKLPLIVYYYGGALPVMRGFIFQHHSLAANGYPVLVITPRGAIGAGTAFADSHANDWGPRAAADILAGIDSFLSDHPEIDPERIGLYGGSYGGFMTAYLLSLTDRFAAAVDLFGISNLASYWGDGAWGWTYNDVAAAGSFPWNAAELYAGHSPLYRADRITTPLLLLHGEDDANVPAHESEQLYTALRVQDRPVELVVFPGEDHGISSTWSVRAQHRSMMLDWFDRHLRGQPEAWEARWP